MEPATKAVGVQVRKAPSLLSGLARHARSRAILHPCNKSARYATVFGRSCRKCSATGSRSMAIRSIGCRTHSTSRLWASSVPRFSPGSTALQPPQAPPAILVMSRCRPFSGPCGWPRKLAWARSASALGAAPRTRRSTAWPTGWRPSSRPPDMQYEPTNALARLPDAYGRWRASRLGQITDHIEEGLILELVGPPACLRILDVG